MKHLVWLALALPLLAACDDGGGPQPEPEPQVWAEAFPVGDRGALLSVWGRGGAEIWTVGGQPDAGLAFRFDGTEWSSAAVPDGPLLNWVHGSGDALWIVGNSGRSLRQRGDGFELVDTGTDQDLWGVWAASPDRAWAVGGNATELMRDPDPVLIEWDGSQWSPVELPELDTEIRAFFKVWGTGPDNVFAVGQRGVIVHWDGTAWRQQLAGTSKDFVSLWGTGPEDIVAVGGRANGLVARYDGTIWTSQVLDREPGLNGVWVGADGTAWIAGQRGRLLRMPAGGFDYTREENMDITLLHGIWSTAEGHRVAVGGTLDSSPPWTGIALEVGR